MGAIANYEVERFDASVEQVVAAQESPLAKLDGALGFIVSYLDSADATSRVQADPAFAVQSSADTIDSHYRVPHRDTHQLLAICAVLRAYRSGAAEAPSAMSRREAGRKPPTRRNPSCPCTYSP